MRKLLRDIIIAILIVTAAFSVFKISNKYSMSVLKGDIDFTVISKSCENAKAIATDDNKNLYIAYRDWLKAIDNEGKEKILFKNKELDIEDIIYYENKIIYISGDKLEEYSLDSGLVNTLYSGIPNGGNGIDRKLLLKDDIIYLSVGGSTNSGIAEGNEVDLPSMDITLTGINYKDTGAFKVKGIISSAGEKISKVAFGNGALYYINLKNNKMNLYSNGIRGITGFDFNSEDEMMAIFSGMKNEGLRPVNRDKDYIYKVEIDKWYGWPDYSGGDPISSPRFKEEEIIQPLIANPPTHVIDGLVYQHKTLDTLKELAIDTEGTILEKDSLLFWDKEEAVICALSPENIYFKVLKIKESSEIKDIIFNKDEFLILDSSLGCIYRISQKQGMLGFKLPIEIWTFILGLTFVLLSILVLKLTKKFHK
ncbi:hypothetical protein [Clostridium vincentii]|uniref:Glucose/Sorbosone dehydrogenase domain-containing protein n=1 Tax=Clostridium vincentii TaxID=52704 RepID=A0A2T0BHQ1_9CLOT|nr:hypothetical protein [Clostridium vincentii]PRR83373.1 hypothetical protein CLVI_09200 [Clostridium vincentii]